MEIKENEVDTLAEIIRKVDGNHTLGAGALAEAIYEEYKKTLRYGCHLELFDGQEPDGCVIDTNEYHSCFYVKVGMKKEDCQYWRRF